MEPHYKAFLKELEVRNYSPVSILKYARCLRIFSDFLRKREISDLRKVGREEMKAYGESILVGQYSYSYKEFNIRTVKHFFRYLKRNKVILRDFSETLKEPRIPQTLPKAPLTAKEVKAMLEAPDQTPLGIRDRAILETFYSSGIRVQEMARLTLMDMDLENGFLSVREGKGKKDRTVPLGREACASIKTYLKSSRPFFAGKAKGPIHSTRLWINRLGHPLEKADIVHMVRKYRKQAGLGKQVTAHAFRRTLAVELIRNECDFLAVKDILGHSSSRTTLRYCALSGVDLREALKNFHPRYDGPANAVPSIKGL